MATPTHETFTNDDGVLVSRTTWTDSTGIYFLVRVGRADEPVSKHHWLTYDDDHGPRLTEETEMLTFVRYFVNWSARGARCPDEAEGYGEALIRAAGAAREFTEIRLSNS